MARPYRVAMQSTISIENSDCLSHSGIVSKRLNSHRNSSTYLLTYYSKTSIMAYEQIQKLKTISPVLLK